MGFISDIFGGPEGPKQRDVDEVSGKAQEQESARLRSLSKELVNDDPIQEGIDFAESGLIQFGDDSAEANVFGTGGVAHEGVTEKVPEQEFQWTLGMMPEGLSHSEALDWLGTQDGLLEEGGISGDDEAWLRDWMSEADASQHNYLFKEDFREGADGWNWDANINETNQTRLRELQALQKMYAPQLT